MDNRPIALKVLLEKAQQQRYAVGAFNCRYLPMIKSVLKAAQSCESPVCIQISQREAKLYEIDLYQFVRKIKEEVKYDSITIPYVIHLDHTSEFDIIKTAIDAGFTSVMIDASQYELFENIARTKEVVQYAHAKDISVEAELGKISSTDKLETDSDEMLYTSPEEARIFIEKTKVDALAISIGTAHGVYAVKNPRIDFGRLKRIRALVDIPLVLHGGTGVPEQSIKKAISIEGGGISKLNIATELEMEFLAAIHRDQRMTVGEINALDDQMIQEGRAAVEKTVQEKMRFFLGSIGQA
ncbi:class II fructose-bisphosphate aldolase [Petroclostridium sp. X23]|uniref:class II fructose-bisphosphate aldolase n=1 Tax=Petroclostridium sp. X23 TaxID=3045146 RepID=UPI0024ACFD49|nr:class II fructose-bisphosphate aldolase [Petroclostridium sp. X23]WHH57112.1 class II fructose-bisphosphate aldolase [Petroclostridium sp. X23]